MKIDYKVILKTKKYDVSLKKYVDELYTNKGLGYKSISRSLGISYTQCRKLLEILQIDVRKGRNVVTDGLKKFRKDKALEEHKNHKGFADPNLSRKYTNITRGIQGYYFNKSKNSYSWLRSSWEYIFAKWLDETNHIWETEVTHYNLNGKIYRPDFFIYDDEKNLLKIVEIKGFWDSNSENIDILNEKIAPEVILITDVSKYIPEKSSLSIERSKWLNERILKING